MKNKLIISVTIVIIILGVFTLKFYSSYINNHSKLSKIDNSVVVFLEYCVEDYYDEYNQFTSDFDKIIAMYTNDSNYGENFKNHKYLIDPFTNNYYKFIVVKSDIKEQNGVLILSGGFDGKIDNNIDEISIDSINSLKLIKRGPFNMDQIDLKFYDYFSTGTDIVVGFYCDAFHYMQGNRFEDFEELKQMFNKFKVANYNNIRLLVRGEISKIHPDSNSIELLDKGINARFINIYNVKNYNDYSIGDTITISGRAIPKDEEIIIFDDCKVFPFDLNIINMMNYINSYYNIVGLEYVSPK